MAKGKARLSQCRNCICLHYFTDDSITYPNRCYCPILDFGMPRCSEYVPVDNLEYLEWLLEKKLEG